MDRKEKKMKKDGKIVLKEKEKQNLLALYASNYMKDGINLLNLPSKPIIIIPD